MIALLAVAAMLQEAPAADGAAGDDIVVVASRLKKIRISADSDAAGHVTACKVTVSSGDAGLDEHACQATRECVASVIGRDAAIADCVDQKLILFASTRAAGAQPKSGNDARN